MLVSENFDSFDIEYEVSEFLLRLSTFLVSILRLYNTDTLVYCLAVY